MTAPAESTALPPRIVDTVTLSEEIVDKLKILGYEALFCKPRNLPPVGRYFFAQANKPSDMFPYFASLTCWLFQLAGQQFAEWTEYDDPTQICNTILRLLKGMRFEDAMVTLVKLRQVSPEAICLVLDFLTTSALNTQRFRVQTPSYITTTFAEEAQVDVQAELGDVVPDEIEEEVDMGSGETANQYSRMGGSAAPVAGRRDSSLAADITSALSGGASLHATTAGSMSLAEARALTTSSVTAEQWAIHLEKMLPKLTTKLDTVTREWYARSETAAREVNQLGEILPESLSTLTKLAEQVQSATERIKTRETYLNADLTQNGGLGNQVKETRLKLKELETERMRLQESVGTLAQRLEEQTARVNELKTTVTAKSSAMTDASPLRNIQAALQQVKQEIDAMGLRLGILNQTYIQATVRAYQQKSRQELEQKANAAQLQKGISLSKRK